MGHLFYSPFFFFIRARGKGALHFPRQYWLFASEQRFTKANIAAGNNCRPGAGLATFIQLLSPYVSKW